MTADTEAGTGEAGVESRGAWLTAASGHSPHASPPGLHHPEAVTPSHGASQRASRQGGRGCAVIGKIQSFLKIAIPLLPAPGPPLLWGPSQSPTLDVTTACGNAVPGGRRICMCRLPSWVGLGRALPGRTGLTLRVLQDLTASQTGGGGRRDGRPALPRTERSSRCFMYTIMDTVLSHCCTFPAE